MGVSLPIHELYEKHFGKNIAGDGRMLQSVMKFRDFLINKFILAKKFNPNVQNPTDAASAYEEFLTMIGPGGPCWTIIYIHVSRRITEKDRVVDNR